MSNAPDHDGLSYDPDARRDTPLSLKLKERIRRGGPITLGEYMQACLTDPEHGYYVTQQAIGAKGDFVTAPEISQVFGELIGLWSAVVWQQMGSPARFNLVELGPGRGTMMRDALRAAKIVPGFLDAVSLVLVDVAPMDDLADSLATLVPRDRITLIEDINHFNDTAQTILLANEFLDTLPVNQFVRTDGQWHDRGVGLDKNGALQFQILPLPGPESGGGWTRFPRLMGPRKDRFPDAAEGSIQSEWVWFGIEPFVARSNIIAALFIDYGHVRSGLGDTFQAVRGHRYEHPLTSPGEADLTNQVDFEQVGDALRSARRDIAVDGPVTQAEFLGSLGIMERASRLMSMNPQLANEIEMGVARLMAVPGMGDRFKVLGVRSAHLPPLPGFPM